MFESLKPPLFRASLALASFVSSSLLVLAVGAVFDSASSQPWLRESPQSLRVAQRCAALPERAARHACVKAAVAQAQARDAGAAQLAAAGPVAEPASQRGLASQAAR